MRLIVASSARDHEKRTYNARWGQAEDQTAHHALGQAAQPAEPSPIPSASGSMPPMVVALVIRTGRMRIQVRQNPATVTGIALSIVVSLPN